jgi:hypothetical protein
MTINKDGMDLGDRRSRKGHVFKLGLSGLLISYGAASVEKYGASSIGLGLALLGLSIIHLTAEIKQFAKLFGRRRGEGNEK